MKPHDIVIIAITLTAEWCVSGLYLRSAYQAYKLRRLSTDPPLRNMWAGVLCMGLALLCKSTALSIAFVVYDAHTLPFIGLWQVCIIFMLFGWHFLIRPDFQSLREAVRELQRQNHC